MKKDESQILVSGPSPGRVCPLCEMGVPTHSIEVARLGDKILVRKIKNQPQKEKE